ncbi:MAG TPA: hypothetical protein PK908_06890, partial [Bacteroidales bacterium]|nr:hypothetical protein [Bacteroidales bacterium]
LGKKNEALTIFNSMLAEADRQLSQPEAPDDFFAKFGQREAENARLSNIYLLKGLACKGLADTEPAAENLSRAVDLSESNLWARSELNRLDSTY